MADRAPRPGPAAADPRDRLPAWLGAEVAQYLLHTAAGVPIRALARAAGLPPSTVSRRVARLAARRADPAIDRFLADLAAPLAA
ncbi:helix-turn-helix domain-containing protein [Defluviimonas sp. D31]|uniref:helix-turn-helix domain-containing protein n=1 Tax=Defluviimonas sp. D31 TaxID=3083253 RepID=UPI00296FD795|nr:helix-turn-helix domain-containing protein [Defluviimonas sp. D31]MDW4550864.1 helix-turn-helix domain-containing protein [Defluviimonas sp. D31]